MKLQRMLTCKYIYQMGNDDMGKFISFCKPQQEQYEGKKIMTDPGVHSAVAEEIKKRVEKNASILDIGAGAGAFSLRLSRIGYNVHAVDVEDSVFDVPAVSFTKVKPESSLSDILGTESFEAVTAIEVIEHVRSTYDFFREAEKLLLPGGHLFLTTPNLCSFYGRIVFLKEGRFFHFQGKDSWEMGHINPLPYFILEQFAKEAGFTLLCRRGIGYMPILDWSGFRFQNLFTAFPRMLLNLMMKGPGPKEGNILLYCFKKETS